MEARILKKVKRRAALCATCAAASLLAACSSTQEAAPEEPSYRSPYQSYRSLCVVPAEEHSASFDLTLARMLRDRGFEPELLETGDLPSVRRCRGIVTFSTGRTPTRARPTTWRPPVQRAARDTRSLPMRPSRIPLR